MICLNKLSSLSHEDKEFAAEMAILVLSDDKRIKTHTIAQDMLKIIYKDLPIPFIIIKENIFIGHGQSDVSFYKKKQKGDELNVKTNLWFYPVCATSKFRGFASGVFTIDKQYYFIAKTTRFLKLLPRTMHAYPGMDDSIDKKCYLNINYDNKDYLDLIDMIRESAGLKSYSLVDDNLEKVFPDYDGLTDGNEIILFPRTLAGSKAGITLNLTDNDKQIIKKEYGFNWTKNPMRIYPRPTILQFEYQFPNIDFA